MVIAICELIKLPVTFITVADIMLNVGDVIPLAENPKVPIVKVGGKAINR